MALRLFSTLLNMAIPASVKAKGVVPPKLLSDGITPCDTIVAASSLVSSNRKSSGKRTLLRRTACLSTRVSTS
ncbi:MAG: hypothetical protein ABI432_10620 [Flavobacteriales bacterium]